MGAPHKVGQSKGQPEEAGSQRPTGCCGGRRTVVAGTLELSNRTGCPAGLVSWGLLGLQSYLWEAALLLPAQFRAQEQSDVDPGGAQTQKCKNLPQVTRGSHSSLTLPAVTLELGATCWSLLLTRKVLGKAQKALCPKCSRTPRKS